MIGGEGNDVLDGGADGEGDFLGGGAGDDRLIVHDRGDFVDAGAGDDLIEIGENGPDILLGGEGIDHVVATAASHTIRFTDYPGGHTFPAGFFPASIERFEADVIALADLDATGGSTPASLYMATTTTLASDGGTAELRGGARNDSIYGTEAGELIDGGAGKSAELQGNGGDDTINGGAGLDSVIGGEGNDVLDGGADGEGDFLSGGAGDDRLIVHDRGDFVDAGAGDDLIEIGENGPDILLGGEGIDHVVATAASHTIRFTDYPGGHTFPAGFFPASIERFEADVIALADLDATRAAARRPACIWQPPPPSPPTAAPRSCAAGRAMTASTAPRRGADQRRGGQRHDPGWRRCRHLGGREWCGCFPI